MCFVSFVPSFKRPGYLEVRREKCRFFLDTNLGWRSANAIIIIIIIIIKVITKRANFNRFYLYLFTTMAHRYHDNFSFLMTDLLRAFS